MSIERIQRTEQVIGLDDSLPIVVLKNAIAQSASVGRIVDNTPARQPMGTGALVGEGLLLTNYHVLPQADQAAAAKIQFGYDELDSIVDEYDLDPSTWESSPYREPGDGGVDEAHLDFSLVGVKPNNNGPAFQHWGKTEFPIDPPRIEPGDDVFIVQHPRGEPKRVSMVHNEIVATTDHCILYTSDTDFGSSGSPVCDYTWRMVALHHARTSVKVDGTTSEANEAVRLSSILSALSADSRNRLLA